MQKSKDGSAKQIADEKKEEVIEIPLGRWLAPIRNNPLVIVTVVLAVLLAVSLVFNFRGGLSASGEVLSAQQIGNNVLSFANSNPDLQGQVSVSSSERDGQLYKVNLNVNGQDFPVYATLDGKYLVGSVVPLSGNTGADATGTNTPSAPIDVSADDDAVLGDSNAPVTIIEFSDYQCPFCRKWWSDTFHSLKKDYIDTGKVKLIFRDFPLEFHDGAIPYAMAAECARDKYGESAYWKMHDKIFSEQNKLDGGDALKGPVTTTVAYPGDEVLKKWAKEIGYDIGSCLSSKKFESEIQADSQAGASYGVSGTPGFFVNGILIEGAQPYAAFKQAIDAQLAKAQ